LNCRADDVAVITTIGAVALALIVVALSNVAPVSAARLRS
jgi:hypothetical protein